MNKIGKGPNSLSSLLDQELKADPPAWDTIQPQTAEYVKLVADLGQMEPAKGSKESWSKWTATFAESATALDKAARTKDLSAAQSAQEKLKAGCMDCHREHRGGPGGFRPGGPRDGPPRPPA